MNIAIVVAASMNNAIGKNNALPWHLKNDLQFFKKLTTNHCIIMGKNTYLSIGKCLPNRVNIILTSDVNFKVEGAVVRQSLQDAIDYCQRWKQETVFIIGGGQVYNQSMDVVTEIYLTRVEVEIADADAFFPELDSKRWTLQNAERKTKDEHNDHDHVFEHYKLSTSEPIVYR
jgi:dihydrofolate reductase